MTETLQELPESLANSLKVSITHNALALLVGWREQECGHASRGVKERQQG